ncbi:Protein of unknown function DUF324 [Beggiatoa sp. PS]|nr:Protein of unknown function DUF324 [Beggiatoa sp. PS]
MSYKKGYRFTNRYLITGLLTVDTPLHIGSGDTTAHPELKADDKFIDIAAVAKDVRKKPYIPASTFKGNLRAWLATRVKDKSLLEKVFGGYHTEKNAEGGKAEFSESYLAEELPESDFPYWIYERQTGVQVGVTIDRRKRTAREERLFYWEVVPPKVTFEVRITGQDLQDNELALLLGALEGFNNLKTPITLGSETAQNQGKMRWHSFKIQCLDAAQTIVWLNKPDDERNMWFEDLPSIDEAKFIKQSQQLVYEQSTRPTLRLHLQLQFDSPFLVNEPSKIKKGKKAKGEPDFQPRHDANGKPLLPAKSFRGAIRSQAERIIRTLKGKACLIDDEKLACDPIEKYEEVEENLCLACQLFGTGGWQTPIRISDFTLVHSQGEFDQDFVAIDRFTGGSCEHAKFKAKAVYAPLLEGTWEIDLQRINPWGLGLLALVIRDLMEGDVTFGYGAAKGYGHCYAKLQNWSVNALPNAKDYPAWKEFTLNPEILQECHDNKTVLSDQKHLINCFVNKFQDKCQ